MCGSTRSTAMRLACWNSFRIASCCAPLTFGHTRLNSSRLRDSKAALYRESNSAMRSSAMGERDGSSGAGGGGTGVFTAVDGDAAGVSGEGSGDFGSGDEAGGAACGGGVGGFRLVA